MRYWILTICLLSGCEKPAGQSGAERFVAIYRTAYDSGDAQAALALVHWEGVPEESRQGMSWMLTNYVGQHKITKTVLTPFKARPSLPPWKDGRKLVSNIPPLFRLEVTTERTLGSTNEASATVREFFVGTKDGKFLFCGLKFAVR